MALKVISSSPVGCGRGCGRGRGKNCERSDFGRRVRRGILAGTGWLVRSGETGAPCEYEHRRDEGGRLVGTQLRSVLH